jgi:alkaline phosphatase D
MKRRDVLASGAAVGAAAVLPGCAALAQDRQLSSLCFASCFDQTQDQVLVEHMARQPFDLVVFGGDNVYYGSPGRGSLAHAYATAATLPGFSALRARPHLAVWDDNDYGPGDGGGDFAGKQQSKDQFLSFWQVPTGDPRRSRAGLYHAVIEGPPGRRVQVVVLDTRWFRSRIERKPRLARLPGEGGYVPDPDPARTMLGSQQWAWLEEQLRAPADLRLVVSSIQVLAEGHSWERWGNLPAERERLFAIIRSTGANGVVLLSGDRHFAALYRREAGLAYPLTELTSSGVTHAWSAPTDLAGDAQQRLADRNYGTVRIDWASRRVELAARNLRGDRIAQTLSLDELKAKT